MRNRPWRWLAKKKTPDNACFGAVSSNPVVDGHPNCTKRKLIVSFKFQNFPQLLLTETG